MIVTELYDGQGLGNQLWAMAVTRLIAHHRGCEFAIIGRDRFKGRAFIDTDFGIQIDSVGTVPNDILPIGITNYYREKCELFGNEPDTGYDPDLFNIPNNTKIDGNFQSYQYVRGKEDLVRSWFKINAPDRVEDDVCVIHFRAGDYLGIPDVLLTEEYYDRAIAQFPGKRFVVVSDMPEFATRYINIPTIGGVGSDPYKASHHTGGHISVDFGYLYNAKNLIISNSSFSWWAAFLNTRKDMVVAPEYWAGWKYRKWKTGDIKTDGFTYV